MRARLLVLAIALVGSIPLGAAPPYERVLRGDQAERARVLESRIDELQAQGKIAEACGPAAELRQLRSRVQGADHWEAADARRLEEMLTHLVRQPEALRQEYATSRRLAEVEAKHRERGQYPRAEQLSRQVLASRRRVFGEEHDEAATCANNLAFNLQAQGKFAEAESVFRQALQIQRRVLGEQHPRTIMSYNNLAYTLNAPGQWFDAERLHRQALAECRRVLGGVQDYTAHCCNNLGSTLDELGRHTEAEPLYREALAISQKLGDNELDVARHVHNLAVNFRHQGKHAEAEPLFRQALATCVKRLGEEHHLTAHCYGNLAGNLSDQEKYAEADPLHRKALALTRRLLGEHHPETANCYGLLASSLGLRGRDAEGQPLFEKALAIHRERWGEYHSDTVSSYVSLALCLHGQGKAEDALGLLRRAARAHEGARLRSTGWDMNRGVFGSRSSVNPFLAVLLARSGQAEEAWRVLENHLSRGARDEARSRRGALLTPEDQTRRRELLDQLDRLQAQSAALAAKVEVDPTRRQSLLERRAEAERQLADLAATVSQRALASREEVQRLLPADAALVAWLDVANPLGTVNEHWGCVLRSRGLPHWVRLRGSGPDGAWTAEDQELSKRGRTALAEVARPSVEVAQLTRRLFAQRLEPLLPHLDGVRQLLVVPFGDLAGVPVEALTDRYLISYVPSGTQRLELSRQPPLKTERTLLAVGDPAYGRAADLPGTQREVQTIARCFDGPTLLLRSAASEQRLEELRSGKELERYRYLHFATHGEAGTGRAFSAALLLADDALPDPARDQPSERASDGRLTAWEVMTSWDLRAELVTLSACESGLGSAGGGEGLLGFVQAFSVAGTRSLLVSLWPVDDLATALLMQRFYQNLLGKRDGLEKPLAKAAALREAKAWLRDLPEKDADVAIARLPRVQRGGERVRKVAAPGASEKPFAHPYYWSAFILIGDPD